MIHWPVTLLVEACPHDTSRPNVLSTSTSHSDCDFIVHFALLVLLRSAVLTSSAIGSVERQQANRVKADIIIREIIITMMTTMNIATTCDEYRISD